MRLILGFFTIFFLFASTVFAQPARVIVLGWDGADYDIVRTMYDAGELPNLAGLGSLSTMYISGITSTKPSWAKILTGLPPEQTGIWANNYAGEIPPGLTVFEKLKTNNGAYNIFISGKKDNTGIVPGQPYANAAQSFDAYSIDQQTMTTIYATAKLFLNEYYLNHSNKPLLAFILTGEPDYQGHLFGSDSLEYANKIRQLDVMLGRLQDNIMQHGGMTNTYIMVLSDHGFNHRNVPYPIHPIPHNFGPVQPQINEPHKSHRQAPFGIITSSFRVFPDKFNNMDVADMILELYGPPLP